MTNAEIIGRATVELIEKGIIEETDEIHTFQVWKKLGYSVKRGEKSQIKFPIWKFVKDKKAKENEVGDDKMFMVTACFFTNKQVEKIKKIKKYYS